MPARHCSPAELAAEFGRELNPAGREIAVATIAEPLIGVGVGADVGTDLESCPSDAVGLRGGRGGLSWGVSTFEPRGRLAVSMAVAAAAVGVGLREAESRQVVSRALACSCLRSK